MMKTCHYKFFQVHIMYSPKVNHNMNWGIWVIMMCQCRFTNDNKCTILVSDVDNGEVMHVLGLGVYGKSLYLPLSCAVNLKLLFKKLI